MVQKAHDGCCGSLKYFIMSHENTISILRQNFRTVEQEDEESSVKRTNRYDLNTKELTIKYL
jgi:hypothetical protein